MDEELARLLERLAEEPDDAGDESEGFSRLQAHAARGASPLAALVAALPGASPRAQRALLLGLGGRAEAELIEAIRGLLAGAAPEVQVVVCKQAATTAWLDDGDIERLLASAAAEVRQAACEAAAGRAGLEAALVGALRGDEAWTARQAAAVALGRAAGPASAEALLRQLCDDRDGDVRRSCAEALEARCRRAEGSPALGSPTVAEMKAAAAELETLGIRSFRMVSREIEERLSVVVDVEKLRGFGRLLTGADELKKLPRAHGVEAAVETVLKLLRGGAPRAVALLGEVGVGKTAVAYEVIRRLAAEGWQALALSPSDFLAGTRYLGDWESRLDDIVKSIKAPRRVVLYIPGLSQLSQVGTTGKSDANIAAMLAPYIERGEVTVLGESSIEEFSAGLGAAGSLRRLFTSVEIQPTTPTQTRDVLRAICDEQGVTPPEGLIDRLMELVGFYITRAREPGRSAGLLRRMLGEHRRNTLTEGDILAQLSGMTGIPAMILDDTVPMDRGRTREFFEARVMGQPEAVRALVDLVTLVKAGLNDPDKPLGVLLFVGPTGVGKTELARALAELLFGDRDRLTRIDMSEFATFDAFERLIGRNGAPGRLTEAVRERPFSVVLLDEIEKGHLNVFDLCLQIFDAGRLTDASGRTSDFRRSIIILTSNVGSRVEREGPVGFGRGGPQVPERERVMRELERVFRPEFLNRIDRTVIFRPLDAEIAARIARREVAQVLARGGISRRRLVIDVDESVFSLLLREGYSVAFGARPLKRTVERLVLVPLAEQIAEGNAPPGSLLRLLARQGRVDVVVTPPENDADALSLRGPPPPRPSELLAVAQRRVALVDRAVALRQQAEPLAARKAELLRRAALPGFWSDAHEARSALDDIYRLDGLLARLDALDEALRAPDDAADLDALERQARVAHGLLNAPSPEALADAVLSVALVSSHGEPLGGLASVVSMLSAFARRERLDVEVIDERTEGERGVSLLISGAGAWSLLSGERGLHLLLKGKIERKGGRDSKERSARPLQGREVLRVDVAPVTRGRSVLDKDEVRLELRPLEGRKGSFLPDPRWDAHAVHLPSMRSLHAWLAGSREQASERALLLLRARVAAAEAEPSTIVRRYILGPVERVRDLRTGLSSPRLDRVLAGELELLGR